MDKPREKVSRYNLVTGEDTYASQTAQNPATSRELKALIPSSAGDLLRQAAPIQLTDSGIPLDTMPDGSPAVEGLPITWMFEYAHNNAAGQIVREFFCTSHKYRLNSFMSKPPVLFKLNTVTMAWVAVPEVQLYYNVPQAVVINNLMHLSDGVNSWIYDGTTWVQDGMARPYVPLDFAVQPLDPANNTYAISTVSRSNGIVSVVLVMGLYLIQPGDFLSIDGVANDSFNGVFKVLTVAPSGINQIVTYAQSNTDDASTGGTAKRTTFAVNSNRYYWYTWADETPGRVHESSSSPISIGTGTFTDSVVELKLPAFIVNAPTALGANRYQYTLSLPTTIDATLKHVNLLTADAIGQGLWIRGVWNDHTVYCVGQIISYVNDGAVLSVIVEADATTDTDHAGTALVAPLRTTHVHFYASESDESKVGMFLASVSLQDLAAHSTILNYIDQSPFLGESGNYFTQIFRPVRNDPTPASTCMAVHKYRIFRRRDSMPNFFNFTAAEEVLAGANGSPEECVPGASKSTVSDMVNETSFPDSSNRIRAMCSHGDSLWIGTEKQCLPLMGESVDDFAISQVSAFSVGVAGHTSMISTPHGLVFMSYDRKVYLYPTSNNPYAYQPNAMNVTDLLVELGRPLRKHFERIKADELDSVQLCFYNYGRRDWLLVSYKDNADAYHTWVYDFETKGWIELATGYVCCAVFEMSAGNKILVGGGTDGIVWVVDDLTGTYVSGGQLPAATWRPALIDFGNPDAHHIFRYVEMELTNDALANSITVNYYLDPQDADNPGVPKQLVMQKVRGANLYRGFPKGGSFCQRLLLEFSIASDTNSGGFRGVKLVADPAAALII